MTRTRKFNKILSVLLTLIFVLTMFPMAAYADNIPDHDRISVAAGEYAELIWRSETTGTSDYLIGDIEETSSGYYPASMVFYVDDGTISGTGITATPLFSNDAGTAYNLQLPNSQGSFTVALDGGDTYTIYYDAPSGNPPEATASIYAYCPAPGQFTNEGVTTGGWGDAYTSTGQLKLNNTTGVSLGSFGGYVVYKFESNLNNSTSTYAGTDFIVYGNAFWNNSEPGHIQVAQDVNGAPGDANSDGVVWYDIAASRYYNSGTNPAHWAKYTNPTPANDSITTPANNLGAKVNVPYIDSESLTTQYVTTNNFHTHSYFPLYCNYFAARYSFTYPISRYNTLGRFVSYDLDATDGSELILRGVKIDSFVPTNTTNNTSSYAFGYADAHPNKSLGGNTAYNPYLVNSTSSDFDTNAANTSGGDPIDISWAVYPAEKENGTATNKTGEPVHLDSIKYVRIYTSAEYIHNLFGETSTEVEGVATVSNPTSGSAATPTSIKIGDIDIETYVASDDIDKETRGSVVYYDASTMHLSSGTVYVTADSGVNIYANSNNSTNGSASAGFSSSNKIVRVIVQADGAAPYIAVIKF